MNRIYRVLRPEVHISQVAVVADSPEAAITKVKEGEGIEIDLSYLRTMDTGFEALSINPDTLDKFTLQNIGWDE